MLKRFPLIMTGGREVRIPVDSVLYVVESGVHCRVVCAALRGRHVALPTEEFPVESLLQRIGGTFAPADAFRPFEWQARHRVHVRAESVARVENTRVLYDAREGTGSAIVFAPQAFVQAPGNDLMMTVLEVVQSAPDMAERLKWWNGAEKRLALAKNLGGISLQLAFAHAAGPDSRFSRPIFTFLASGNRLHADMARQRIAGLARHQNLPGALVMDDRVIIYQPGAEEIRIQFGIGANRELPDPAPVDSPPDDAPAAGGSRAQLLRFARTAINDFA